MELKQIIFKPEHLEVADIRPLESNGILNLPETQTRLEKLSQIGDATTLIYDGRIIGFTGFLEIWPGVAEIWLIPTIYIQTASLTVARLLKNYVKVLAKTFKLHRLQTVAPDDELHNRWMSWLGFQEEGLLRQYSQFKMDYKQWARVYKWE
jgi:RimJ/RimL family protein N-acetyltransferase